MTDTSAPAASVSAPIAATPVAASVFSVAGLTAVVQSIGTSAASAIVTLVSSVFALVTPANASALALIYIFGVATGDGAQRYLDTWGIRLKPEAVKEEVKAMQELSAHMDEIVNAIKFLAEQDSKTASAVHEIALKMADAGKASASTAPPISDPAPARAAPTVKKRASIKPTAEEASPVVGLGSLFSTATAQ
jgi:hypothetical protein